MQVVKHGSVDDARVGFGEGFQILEVRRDDAENLVFEKTLKDGLCNGAAYLRLSAAAELIDQEEAFFISLIICFMWMRWLE